jgi:hypothetical protein
MPYKEHIGKKYIKDVLDAYGLEDESHLSIDDQILYDIESYGGVVTRIDLNKESFNNFDELNDYIYSDEFKNEIESLSIMIGFIMDRSVNVIGSNGWDRLLDIVSDEGYDWIKAGLSRLKEVI